VSRDYTVQRELDTSLGRVIWRTRVLWQERLTRNDTLRTGHHRLSVKFRTCGARDPSTEGRSPIKPPAEPDQGGSCGICSTPRLDMALLIQRQLLAQKEILCRESRAWVQAEPEVAWGINDEREQYGCQLEDVAKSVQAFQRSYASL